MIYLFFLLHLNQILGLDTSTFDQRVTKKLLNISTYLNTPYFS